MIRWFRVEKMFYFCFVLGVLEAMGVLGGDFRWVFGFFLDGRLVKLFEVFLARDREG